MSDYRVAMTEMAAVHRAELGERASSFADRRAEVIAAVDLPFTGI